MPRVSIVIPAYNRAHLIERAIDSVLAQTYQDFEIIVVDDGSTDNTREFLAARYGTQVHYIYQDNKGAGAARNTGLRAARGEFIEFLDSDDTLMPLKLERQVAFLDAHPDTDVVLCSFQCISEDGSTILEEFHLHSGENMLRGILQTGFKGLFPPFIALVRRKCFDTVKCFDKSLPAREEQDLWLRIALEGFQYDVIDEVLCNFWSVPNSRGKNLENAAKAMQIIWEKVFNHPKLPADIARSKNDIIANSHANMGLEYLMRSTALTSPELLKARDYFVKGLALDPNILTQFQDFIRLIPHKAIDFDPADPEEGLNRLLAMIFEGSAIPPSLKARLIGSLHMIQAFQSYEAHNRREVTYHVLRSIRFRPANLLNWGSDSIFIRSLFGSLVHRGK